MNTMKMLVLGIAAAGVLLLGGVRSAQATSTSSLGIGGSIPDAAVETAKIGVAAVTTAKMADEAVTTAKLADSSVTSAKIAALNVTAAKIDALAVDTTKINIQSINTTKMVRGTPETNKIVCHRDDGSFGHCMAGSQINSDCRCISF